MNPFKALGNLFKKELTVSNLEKWLGAIQALAPILLPLVSPELAPIAGSITDAIQQAEQLGAAGTLSDKLSHVQKIASDAAATANTVAGKTVVDPTLLDKAVNDAVSTTVSVANLVTQIKK